MQKTKDLFLNIAANPNMTLEDLASVGLTSENTMLLDRALYASSEKVQDMFRDENGNFNQKKFDTVYDIAVQSYNILANDEANLNLMDVTVYDVDNIFVDPSKRKLQPEPIVVKLHNPDRLNVGITRIGKNSERVLSRDEIAQTQLVLLNPTAVAKGEKPVYGDSPNDSWFSNFWDTRVLASWDEDGTHIDPITGLEMQHTKGDLKLNDNGTYYYESLDGRSVYGKQVLNKFNTLTTDGSVWNKYDFFDSDDIEQKSIGGSVFKNLALVGTMFIPYVGWGVAAASIAHQMAGLGATFGKMLVGADNETLNAIEGWVKSTDRRTLKTEYALQKTWCWENFINLVGDITAQLREQRAIFKFAPGIIKGDFKALDEAKMLKYEESLAKEYMENATNLSFKDLMMLAQKQNPGAWKEQFSNLMVGAKDIYTRQAKDAVRKYMESYYKLGEPIAKAYMTAITVLDTFGEAIEAGATNSEATLLTLGYAAAEYALLSTGLGTWIMPELRTNKLRYKMIGKKLLELPKEARDASKQLSKLGDKEKLSWAKRLFNIGKDIAKAEYSMLPKTVGTVAALGLGEGFEEVSEEFLADFSKSCFNVVQQLLGDDVKMTVWNNMRDRYGMALFGGFLGGSINAAASDYKDVKSLNNMTSQQALQQLVYMTRNDELDDFWKTLRKTKIASTELSTQLNDNGIGYKLGTADDNQDLEAKKWIGYIVQQTQNIINAENAKLNDSGLLATLIKADPKLQDLEPVKEYRMQALANSATAGKFLNEWNTICSDIVKTRLLQNEIINKYGDTKKDKYSEDDEKLLKNLGNSLKELQKRKDALLNGDRTYEFVRDASFEMTHAVKEEFDKYSTEIIFAEWKTGKKYIDINETDRTQLKEEYEAFKQSSEYAEQVHTLAEIYETLAKSSSQAIKESNDFYLQVLQGNYSKLESLKQSISQRLDYLADISKQPENLEEIQKILNDKIYTDVANIGNKWDAVNQYINSQINNLGENASQEDIENIYNAAWNEYRVKMLKESYEDIEKVYKETIQAGFIHPEIKLNLIDIISLLLSALIAEFEEYGDPLYDNLIETLDGYITELKLLLHTPIINNLTKFQLSTNTNSTVIDLLKTVLDQESITKQNISEFQLSGTTVDLFELARKLLGLYRSTIAGARYDNVDLDTIIGFNSILNELTPSDEKFAEIDGATADLILEDIDLLFKRLNFAESLHQLNVGNKYNIQNNVALNKLYILYNKIKYFVSILGDDWEEGKEELEKAIEAAEKLQTYSKNKIFSITPEDKAKIEEESINILTALHKFLQIHINPKSQDEASNNKLKKVFNYENFPGLIRQNDSYLSEKSVDIDDSAFIWWLCAVAALDPYQFYNNYRHSIGVSTDPNEPIIAPIPTLELGVFAMTAAVTNGEMFKKFGEILRTSLLDTWNISEDNRKAITTAYGSGLLEKKHADYFKNLDFLPNFDNIVFIEGIAGSGKTKGVLRMWKRLMSQTNPEIINSKILLAHTSIKKAEDLGKELSFQNVDYQDHNSLLKYISSEYTTPPLINGVLLYKLNEDVILTEDGLLRSKCQLNKHDVNDVPKIIIIDEWSHYNQIEQELLQRFADEYGCTIFAMGDYDQLTPKAGIFIGDSTKPDFIVTPHRNMSIRTPKLGVSMRTDNEIKNENIYRMLAWKLNPTSAIDLHYYEDDQNIYGDKIYKINDKYGSNELESIKNDVRKMISTLSDKEQIGYVYHDMNSELYKLLTNLEFKKYIEPLSEKDAHGLEAKYYIIEPNRNSGQDALDFFESVYTGITRSELGSLLIIGTSTVKNPMNQNKFNQEGLLLINKEDSEILPNTYTEEGTLKYAENRKSVLTSIFGDKQSESFTILPKTRKSVNLIKKSEKIKSTVIEPIAEPTPTVLPLPTPTREPNQESVNDVELTAYDLQNIETDENLLDNELSTTQLENELTEELNNSDTSNKQVPINDPFLNLPIYDKHGLYLGLVINITDAGYELLFLGNSVIVNADYLKNCFISRPKTSSIYKLNLLLLNIKTGAIFSIETVQLTGNYDSPVWQYITNNGEILYDADLMSKDIIPYEEVPNEEDIPTTVESLEGELEYLQIINETESDIILTPILSDVIDYKFIGFTFNTLYTVDDEHIQDGNLNIPPEIKRIDNGYGLAGLGYKTKKDVLELLKLLHPHLRNKSNADIIETIRDLIPSLEKSNLKVKWAFISKSKEINNSDWNAFLAPKAKLYNSGLDAEALSKSISIIIYKDGKPVLEIPVLTFPSPHSIIHNLKLEYHKNEELRQILAPWKNHTAKYPTETMNQLNGILNNLKNVDEKSSNYAFYQQLRNMITLWLFTNNGVKFLPEDWNLSQQLPYLGNFYVTERISDNGKFNYSGEWVNIEETSHTFTSSILMNNDAFVPFFRPYVPYIFISDDPAIRTDKLALDLYLKLQDDPKQPPKVRLVPVCPPEVSVEEYITNAYNILISNKAAIVNYGNAWTPYRIWNAILQYKFKNMDRLKNVLGDNVLKDIKDIVDNLNSKGVEKTATMKEKMLAAKEQLKILVEDRINYNKNSITKYAFLRTVLVELVYHRTFGLDTIEPNAEILDMIDKACKSNGITGVLCKPKFSPKELDGESVFKIETGQSKYIHHQSNQPYKIFGKIDTPAYNLSGLSKQLTEWIDDVQLDGNIWKFKDEFNLRTYKDSIDALWRNNSTNNIEKDLNACQELLNNLKLKDIPIEILKANLAAGKSLKEVVKVIINRKFIKLPASFILLIGDKFKYGKLDTEVFPKLEGYILSIEDYDATSNILTFVNNDKKLQVEYEIINNGTQFKYKPLNLSKNTESVITLESVQAQLNKPLLQKLPITKQLLDSYDYTSNSFNMEKVLSIINGMKNTPTKLRIERIFKLNEDNQSLDKMCINPIIGTFL